MTLYQCSKCGRSAIKTDGPGYCDCGGVYMELDLSNVGLIERTRLEADEVVLKFDKGVFSYRAIAKKHGLNTETVKKILRAAGRID